MGRHWNPGITVAEVDSFAKSTWEGVNHDPYQAHLYLSVCCEESGMHLLDNPAGFGYAGARWAVVIRALNWKGGGYWAYSEHHIFEVNKAIARLFAGRNYSESTIHRWHNSGNRDNDRQYAMNVSIISKYNGR